jgi:hypothetical protein
MLDHVPSSSCTVASGSAPSNKSMHSYERNVYISRLVTPVSKGIRDETLATQHSNAHLCTDFSGLQQTRIERKHQHVPYKQGLTEHKSTSKLIRSRAATIASTYGIFPSSRGRKSELCFLAASTAFNLAASLAFTASISLSSALKRS